MSGSCARTASGDGMSELEKAGEWYGEAEMRVVEREEGTVPQSTRFRQMARVLREYDRRVEAMLRPIGLTRGEYEVLLITNEWSDIPQSKLAEECHFSRQRMHELVARLEQLKLVTLSSDPKRREVRVMLAGDGARLLSEANAALREFRNGMLDRFGVRHQAALGALLDQLEVALRLWESRPHLFDD